MISADSPIHQVISEDEWIADKMFLLIDNPVDMDHFRSLISKPYRPKEIVELEAKLEGEIRAGDLAYSITKTRDLKHEQRVIDMLEQRDRLYLAWVTES